MSKQLKKPESRNSKLDWDGLYSALDKTLKKLKSPSDTIDSFVCSLDSARFAENILTQKFIEFSRLLANAKKDLALAKLIYSTRFKAILSDPDISSVKNTREKKALAGAYLVEEQKQVDLADDFYTRVQLYVNCLNKGLSSVKHFREDLGRRIKLIGVHQELSREI